MPFAFRFPHTLWSPLRTLILRTPPQRLTILPALGGSIWFVTLAGLLLTWLGRGMPRYPGQRNPDVAFISEIASFELKPFFLVGSSITATLFVGTIIAVHVLRYESSFGTTTFESAQDGTVAATAHEEEDHDDVNIVKTLKLISLLSILAAVVASVALILFGALDTFRHHDAHERLIRLCFAALALQAVGTAVVYVDDITWVISYLSHCGRSRVEWCGKNLRVRVFVSLSTALILLEVFLGGASISLTIPEAAHYLAAGILEWIVAFLGTVYLWLYCGLLDQRNFDAWLVARSQRKSPEERLDPEIRPLLADDYPHSRLNH